MPLHTIKTRFSNNYSYYKNVFLLYVFLFYEFSHFKCDFFGQRSKSITFEPDIEFNIFFIIFFRISALNYPKTRIFCKKKYFDYDLVICTEKMFFLDYHIQKVSQVANIKILRFLKMIQNPLEIYLRLECFYRNGIEQIMDNTWL